MRLPLRWARCLFAGALTLLGQSATESPTNTSCFQRVSIPDHPALARQARIAADVIVSVTFNHQCVGKTTEFVFAFELGNDMPVEGSKQTISFSYPNRFTIASTAVIVNP